MKTILRSAARAAIAKQDCWWSANVTHHAVFDALNECWFERTDHDDNEPETSSWFLLLVAEAI